MSSEAEIACYGCAEYYPESTMEAIDVTRDGEYYPSYIYVCPYCSSGVIRRE